MLPRPRLRPCFRAGSHYKMASRNAWIPKANGKCKCDYNEIGVRLAWGYLCEDEQHVVGAKRRRGRRSNEKQGIEIVFENRWPVNQANRNRSHQRHARTWGPLIQCQCAANPTHFPTFLTLSAKRDTTLWDCNFWNTHTWKLPGNFFSPSGLNFDFSLNWQKVFALCVDMFN